MRAFFEMECIGRAGVSGHFCRCGACRRLTLLNSYTTTRFAKLFGIPAFPAGRLRILDECPHCGHRGSTSKRKYAKVRKHDLARMMDGFTRNPDDPDNCAQGLHTLMVYDEEAWFGDVTKTYGMRFETDPRIQHVIAQGLCRFGRYEEAIAYCRKAIVLGAGKPAQELMDFCHSLLEAARGGKGFEALALQPESPWRAYLPSASLAAAGAAFLAIQGVSSMRNYRAWLVNGSLQEYTFKIDDTAFTLSPGRRMPVKLRLGEHVLRHGSMPDRVFDYSISALQQILGQHLLVINPDAMALLIVEKSPDKAKGTRTAYSIGKQIHVLPGVRHPLFGFRQRDKVVESERELLALYRPPTHAAMAGQLRELGMEQAAGAYARRALEMDPETDEAPILLGIALDAAGDEEVRAFLEPLLAASPPAMPWHLYYQDHMARRHPEHDLAKEYVQRCRAWPDVPENYYLLGRILADREAARLFFQRAEQGRGCGGLGDHAIAGDYFRHGAFREARPYAERAVEKSPGNRAFMELHRQILLALREYGSLLDLSRDGLAADPANADLAADGIFYMAQLGYHLEADAETAAFIDRHHDTLPDGWLPRLKARRFHAVGNVGDYLACLAEAGDPHAGIERRLHEGDVEQARLLVEQTEDHEYWEHLVVYCAANRYGHAATAAAHWEKAVAEAPRATPSQQRLADLLATATQVPPADRIQSLDLPPVEKAVLCAALGFRFPGSQNSLFPLCRTYNFTPGYPQILLKKWMAAAEAEAAPSVTSAHTPQPTP